MEYREFMDAVRSMYKMGFAVGKSMMDMVKIAMDSYMSMYEMYMRQLIPSESYENVKKTIDLYIESQTKVFENFKKLLEQFEKQQDEIFARMVEFGEKAAPKKKE